MRESAALLVNESALPTEPVRAVRFLDCMSLYVFTVASLRADRLK
jgi:hypothetical protein